MSDKSTFIVLDRNIIHWGWWKNRNTLQVFIWLLIKANVNDHKFEKEIIKRGEVATSLETIGNACGLTIQQVRTALDHLKLTGEITSRKMPHYQVISIVNYKRYQDIPTDRRTGKQQANNRQSTGNQQQYNNINHDNHENNNKGRSAPASPSGEIPKKYRDMFKTYDEYLAWRNQ